LLTGPLKGQDLPLILPTSWTTSGMLPWFLGATVGLVAIWVVTFRVIARSRAAGKRLDELQAMTPREFEEWVGARFRDRGYRVSTTPKSGDQESTLSSPKQTRRSSSSASGIEKRRSVSPRCATCTELCSTKEQIGLTWSRPVGSRRRRARGPKVNQSNSGMGYISRVFPVGSLQTRVKRASRNPRPILAPVAVRLSLNVEIGERVRASAGAHGSQRAAMCSKFRRPSGTSHDPCGGSGARSAHSSSSGASTRGAEDYRGWSKAG